MFNYAKSDLKEVTGIDPSKFSKNADLPKLKSDVDKWDIDKIKIALVDLSTLSNVVKMMLLKKVYVMNWLKN